MLESILVTPRSCDGKQAEQRGQHSNEIVGGGSIQHGLK
jgi:hypothetical protein